MRRTITALMAGLAISALLVIPAFAATKPTVMIMKHLCNANIQSVADFVAVENKGAGGKPGGIGTVPGLVATVLACPSIVRTADSYSPGAVASKTKANFNFTINDSAAMSGDLTTAEFMQGKLCEDKVGLDANGDGKISADTCLDVSNYAFSNVAEGAVTVTETTPPDGSRFGVIRFTPGSTDDKALTSALSANPINLDSSKDTAAGDAFPEYADNVIMIHVYDFQNASNMPSTSVEMPVSNNSLPLLLLGFGGLIASAGVAFALRRNRR